MRNILIYNVDISRKEGDSIEIVVQKYKNNVLSKSSTEEIQRVNEIQYQPDRYIYLG